MAEVKAWTVEEIEAARGAIDKLRDSARTGVVIDFRQRDPLVIRLHNTLDAFAAQTRQQESALLKAHNEGALSFADQILRDTGQGTLSPSLCADALQLVRNLRHQAQQVEQMRKWLETERDTWRERRHTVGAKEVRDDVSDETPKQMTYHGPFSAWRTTRDSQAYRIEGFTDGVTSLRSPIPAGEVARILNTLTAKVAEQAAEIDRLKAGSK